MQEIVSPVQKCKKGDKGKQDRPCPFLGPGRVASKGKEQKAVSSCHLPFLGQHAWYSKICPWHGLAGDPDTAEEGI